MAEPQTKYEAKARCNALIERMAATRDRAEWVALDAEARRLTRLADDLPMGTSPAQAELEARRRRASLAMVRAVLT